MKILRSDNGGEYTSRAFKQYLSKKGIRHQKTVPYTPMQNGVAERINRTIQERVTTMLQHSGLKLEFWVVYSVNLSSSKAIRLEVPQALWSRKEPTYDRFHIFGCEAYAFIPREKTTKLSAHATKCIFLSYGADGEFGYRLWDPENRKLIRSSDVVFNEDSILSRNQQKIVGKRVSFEIAKDNVEVLTHHTERTEENKVQVDPDTEAGTLAQIEDKAIKDKAESTQVEKGNNAIKQVVTD